MGKKTKPFNFATPDLSEDAPPLVSTEEGLTLEVPAIPGRNAPTHDKGKEPINLGFLEPQANRGGALPYVLAIAAPLLWAGGLGAFAAGYRSRLGPFEYEPFAAVILAMLAAAPVGLIWIGAFALQQGSRLLAEARRLQVLSDQMLGPAALAAAHTGSTVDAIRLEIESALQTVGQARGQLLQLRHGLAEESQRLLDAVAGSERASGELVRSLGDEREGFFALSGRLETQTADISEAITRHARMVADASDLAQAQIQEAEAALAARAADLAAAAGEASDAARVAGDDLSRQAARLEAAGVTVGEQVQSIEDGLSQQRASLVTLAHAMRTDQEDLAVHFETHRAQFQELLRQSQAETEQLSVAAARGAEALRALIGESAEQIREISEQAQTERDLLGGAALQSLGAFSEAAAFERRALDEETRRAIEELSEAAETAHKAAETSSEAARRKVEQLSEAAFAAGQKADAAFESRLAEARGLIERSVELIEEAGQRSVARLDKGVASAQNALDALQQGLSEIEARGARLPEDAEARGREVKAALDAATGALLQSARAAATELQSIDDAFQDRVKRNYEMLSEAVRLMGVIGGGAAARAGGGAAGRPAPSLRPRLGETPEPRRPAEPASGGEGQPRRRLKLTPTASDEALKTVFEPAAEARRNAERPAPDRAEPEAGGDGWRWTDLLTSMDGGGGEADEGDIQAAVLEEVRALGVDPAALFPDNRVEDIARALETGDVGGAREIAHRLAPAAIRKLARRVLSDKLLRAKADRFIQQQSDQIAEALRRGQTRVGLARSLCSEPGRAYLLFDAAVGDLN